MPNAARAYVCPFRCHHGFVHDITENGHGEFDERDLGGGGEGHVDENDGPEEAGKRELEQEALCVRHPLGVLARPEVLRNSLLVDSTMCVKKQPQLLKQESSRAKCPRTQEYPIRGADLYPAAPRNHDNDAEGEEDVKAELLDEQPGVERDIPSLRGQSSNHAVHARGFAARCRG